LQDGDLIIVAGRPSMGKTTLALNIAENAAIGSQVPTAIFSMEMPSQQLAFRMISSLGRVDQTHLRTGRFPDEDWSRINTAVQLMSEAPIFIDDTPALSPTEIRARARRLQREHGLGLIHCRLSRCRSSIEALNSARINVLSCPTCVSQVRSSKMPT